MMMNGGVDGGGYLGRHDVNLGAGWGGVDAFGDLEMSNGNFISINS